jgi:origin recognition complex subunit 3
VLASIHTQTLDEVTSYLDETAQNTTTSRIPTGIILSAPGSASLSSLSQRVASSVKTQKRRLYVSLESSSAPHLKAVLKVLIQKATASTTEEDEDEELATTSRKGPRLLNYDLQILHEHVRDRKIEQVVVAFPDTEALGSHLLSELIELMSSWLDRIPFVCLFNVATSVEFLQQRLSRSAVRCLDGRLFDAAPSSAEAQLVFESITHPETCLWVGPALLGTALERQSDYIQSIDELVDVVEYAYMSCYYANALSIFLQPDVKLNTVPNDHFEALRTLRSFRKLVESLLAEKDTAKVHKLLQSNAELLSEAKQQMAAGKESLTELTTTLDVLRAIQEHLPNTPTTPKSSLYIQAMSCKLRGSAMIRTLLLSVRKAQSDMASALMESVCAQSIPEDVRVEIITLRDQLAELVAGSSSKGQPLRSEDDIGSSTVRTTVVAQKVHLSKQKSQLSKQDAAYTEILRNFSDLLETYFNNTLINPNDLPFHEVFIYDLKSPHREVFTPRPRHAVERALSSPHDYLDCDCCAPDKAEGEEATLSSTQPATAVLYQLYLESGSLINASDLWQAFQAVMGGEKEEGDLMALFQRELAELRYLGLVKSTRKRADHVAKVAWRGL